MHVFAKSAEAKLVEDVHYFVTPGHTASSASKRLGGSNSVAEKNETRKKTNQNWRQNSSKICCVLAFLGLRVSLSSRTDHETF